MWFKRLVTRTTMQLYQVREVEMTTEELEPRTINLKSGEISLRPTSLYTSVQAADISSGQVTSVGGNCTVPQNRRNTIMLVNRQHLDFTDDDRVRTENNPVSGAGTSDVAHSEMCTSAAVVSRRHYFSLELHVSRDAHPPE